MILSMTSQTTKPTFFHKLGGYYLIPHELLHVLAFRLIGKSCHYQWGDRRVQFPAKLSRRERLFVLLLPGVTTLLLGIFFHMLGFFSYALWVLSTSTAEISPGRDELLQFPLWYLAFLVIASLFILYSGTAYRDVRVALRLLFEEYSQQDSDNEQLQADQKKR